MLADWGWFCLPKGAQKVVDSQVQTTTISGIAAQHAYFLNDSAFQESVFPAGT